MKFLRKFEQTALKLLLSARKAQSCAVKLTYKSGSRSFLIPRRASNHSQYPAISPFCRVYHSTARDRSAMKTNLELIHDVDGYGEAFLTISGTSD